ncbi:PAS domain family protein [Sulfitobacter noctilucae]|uniref:PAS domain-containing protein n=1 Tax=Sulfitobacter noctilucae TaxID=1342302 RepID=UPI00046AD5BE|nr:PAS domain-containing protein [Sulfitobacter noctilucae]KIN61086.1 PAS domain family protein [Sulfitobacter noctilucae]
MDKFPQNAQNVIAMSDHQSETGYAAIAQVEAYWQALRGTRLLPKRSDIDPRGIEQALENAFILERIAPGIARMRIAGSHLNDLMGMEVRGMPLTAFFTPDTRAEVADLLEVVFQTPAIATLHMASPAAGGRPKIEARLVLLPLKSDLGDVSRVLGCFVSKGDLGMAPRRFELIRKEVQDLVLGQPPVRRSDTPHVAKLPSLAATGEQADRAKGMAEAPVGFKGAEEKRRPPYLRLVQSNEDKD